MLGILKGILGKQDTFKGFLDELATKTKNFDDFVEKISIWLELGREKQFFERLMKQALQIEDTITWKGLNSIVSEYKTTEKAYLQRRLAIAFGQTTFKLGPLELINSMVKYKTFDFDKNLSANILPDIDDSETGVPTLKSTTRRKETSESNTTLLKDGFEDVLEKIRTESSDFNDFLARVSDWLGIETELFRRIIEGGLSLNEKITGEKLQNGAIFSKKERTALDKACNQKSTETGIKIRLFRDVVQGCIKKREFFKEIKMQKMREKYLKMTGELNLGRSLTDEEEQQLRARIDGLLKRVKVSKIKIDEIIKFADDVRNEITDLQRKHISLSLKLAEDLKKAFMSREFNTAKAVLNKIQETEAARKLSDAQSAVIIFWANAIENEYKQTQDTARLRELSEMIPDEMAKKGRTLTIGRLKEMIKEKIRTIELKEKLKEMSPEMEELVGRIIRDKNFDSEKENATIDKEAKKQTGEEETKQQSDSAKNNIRYSLKPTYPQARQLIMQKLSNKIGNDPENCMITVPPSEVINRLKQLGTHPMMAVDATISNLIGGKRFLKAEILCGALEKEAKFARSTIDSWRKKVLNAKVANLFLFGMDGERTAQDEQKDYETIEVRIQRNEIDPKAVELGTRPDGRIITLADICSDELMVSR